MKNFGEYHDLYLETNILLLTDIFMNYTIMYLKDNSLDSSYYISAPGMFNNSLYKSSEVELKLITDKDNYLIVEDEICAITQYIPTEILDKVSLEKVSDIQSIAPDAEIDYILEVDLEVLVHLYDYFADYSLAPEKQIISENWLSLYNEISLPSSPDIYEAWNKGYKDS
ncbi:1122_t:CDS:2 [Racocetra persica]|uniref:1122_t:CDS:1 n=1 Tax=Racocetra persica TaxID=160502 RepID=A0ACA9N0P3_9GLOM|nr:1122_t:CDS:2 [Racocetra persica]